MSNLIIIIILFYFYSFILKNL